MSKDNFCKSQLITCNRVNECNGVCPFEDALKHADKEMDEQTVINHDRDWIIGCIEHDGFIHTHRFDKANQIIHDALSAESAEVVRCKDCKYFELDHFDRIDGIPLITAHEICTKWSGGSKTNKDGFCFMGERKGGDSHDD